MKQLKRFKSLNSFVHSALAILVSNHWKWLLRELILLISFMNPPPALQDLADVDAFLHLTHTPQAADSYTSPYSFTSCFFPAFLSSTSCSLSFFSRASVCMMFISYTSFELGDVYVVPQDCSCSSS